MRRGRWALMAPALLLSACGSSAGETTAAPGGVAVAIFRDRSAGSDVTRFHDVPILLVSDDGVAYMDPPIEFAITGELLPSVWIQSITPAGVEALRSSESLTDEFVPDDLGALVGAENLGQLEFYLPDAYLFTATPVDGAGDAPVLMWPAAASISLADAEPCQRLPESEVGEAFETAAAGSLFEQDGLLYSVLAKQAWPGATCV